MNDKEDMVMKFLHKKVLFVLSVFILTSLLIGCQSEPKKNEAAEQITENNDMEKPEPTGIKPIVTMTMENGGVVQMELYPDIAPNTVNNFISLVEAGFYDGLIFHRVIPSFMIQGGDPEGNGTGGPGYSIKGEFSENNFENNLEHDTGVLSMARSQHHDSAGSQFFIMTDPAPHLDGKYAAFGKVIDGMDVVDAIATSETKQEKPIEDQVIESMTIDLKGYEAKEPEVQ